MSLTRDEWIMMWNNIVRIDVIQKHSILTSNQSKQDLVESIEFIKKQIQKVIGQVK